MLRDLLIPQFGYLFEDKLLDEITSEGKLRSFEKDEIIIDINQELSNIPLVLKGSIKIVREDKEEHELLLYFLEEGDTCAMSLTCCMAQSKSQIRATAESDCTIIMIPKAKMDEWFNAYDSWRRFIMLSYQARFDEMLETIDALAFLKLDERLFKYLLDKVKLSGTTTLLNTHQAISEDLNTSRVVVSRLLKQLEREEKIKLSRNKIEVLQF
jgi:CRP/FNR family transcriptional regulator